MSQDLNDIEWTSLARYLAGEGSAAEVEHWMSADPERSVWVGQLRQAFEARQRVPDRWDIEEELKRFRVRVKAHTNAEHAVFKGRKALGPQTLRRGVWFVLAGAMVGMIAIVAGQHVGSMHLGGHRAAPMSTYATGNGERANITLPDGNTVVLNVASRLEVPADYLAGNHSLRLTGEALFTVQHHDGTPFTVVAGPATARVLGTSFLVRYYAADRGTTVLVRDGKVAVHSAALRPVVLTAAQQMHVGQMGSSGIQMGDPAQFSFATGILTLKNLPLPAAIVELDRWYDADIRLGDPTLAMRHVSGKCAAGSLGDLSEILELMYNVRVVRNGRMLTLYPRQ